MSDMCVIYVVRDLCVRVHVFKKDFFKFGLNCQFFNGFNQRHSMTENEIWYHNIKILWTEKVKTKSE